NYEALCLAYVGLARAAIVRSRDYTAASRFGRIAVELVERFEAKRFEGTTYHCYAALIAPWMEHARTSADLMRRAFAAAIEVGDLSNANYANLSLTTNLLVAGDPLSDVQREAERALALAQKTQFSSTVDHAILQLVLIRTLRGLTPTFGCFDSELIEEA